jgi:hypothetical protein
MLLAIEQQIQPSTNPAIAIPILVQAPARFSKKNAAAHAANDHTCSYVISERGG